jgi:adenosyl cobinamide kinase/adenosyl cobinamide phosphate guanylyltransferase
MYPAVRQWLEEYLRNRYPSKNILAVECSSKRLNRLIQHLRLEQLLPPEWNSWEVQVDIAGFVYSDRAAEVVLVECKNRPITLQHLSQIIGYCRIVNPIIGMILSPQGVSRAIANLLEVFNRKDVLVYSESPMYRARHIVLAKWNPQARLPEPNSIIPAGGLI